MLAGADPLMLPLLKKGGAGAITATTNLVARDLAFVFRHFADPARAAEVEAAQARVVAARSRASRFAQMPSLKVLLAQETGDDGWRRVRPPLVPLTAEERSALLARSDAEGARPVRRNGGGTPPLLKEATSMQEFTGAESTLIAAMIVGYILFTGWLTLRLRSGPARSS